MVLERNADDDNLVISGQALSALIKGGAGKDITDIRKPTPEPGFQRVLHGGQGDDVLLKSIGRGNIFGCDAMMCCMDVAAMISFMAFLINFVLIRPVGRKKMKTQVLKNVREPARAPLPIKVAFGFLR